MDDTEKQARSVLLDRVSPKLQFATIPRKILASFASRRAFEAPFPAPETPVYAV